MSVPATVWLVVGLVATVLLGIVVAGIVRQSILVGRSAVRLAREAGEVSEGIASSGRRRTGRR